MQEEPIKSRTWREKSPLVIALLLVIMCGAIGYAMYQRSLTNKLAADNAAASSALAQTQGQLQALNDKINALTTQPAPAQPPVEASSAAHAAAKHAAGHQRRAEDTRFKKMQSQLDEQGRAIESTRQDLTSALDSTKTELNGSIARTHDELVALEKKGERNYYEFDISKSKQLQRTGPVGVELRKANTKHQYADLNLMVNDANLTQKHVNLYQPVAFYAGDNGRPLELVINSITKDHIHGYVSAPKYSQSELASSPDAGSAQTTANQRQKLELPR
jgi:hypothetical protein